MDAAAYCFPAVLLLFLLFSSVILCNGHPFQPKNPYQRTPSHARFAPHNYKDALRKCILFFQGQRSGKLPPNQRMTWRGDSGLSDGSKSNVCFYISFIVLNVILKLTHVFVYQSRGLLQLSEPDEAGRQQKGTVDLVGGYYDAGDNVKFGFPMAFTTTMLSWSVIEFGGVMQEELQHARQAIRWGADYLLKATQQEDSIYVQVGDATMDHACWERPEDMDTPRSVFKIDKNNPGTEVAAETAAAFASASMVFRNSDPSYSSTLLNRAIRVFEFADKYRASYSDGLKPFVCPYYCSYSGYQDELLWGAAWLHRATRNPIYLKYIERTGKMLGTDEADYLFGWDNKHVGARILLSKFLSCLIKYDLKASFNRFLQTFQPALVHKVQGLQVYKGHSDNCICSLIPGAPSSQAQYTPGGLLFKMRDSNMQYVTSTSFLLLTYAKYLRSSRTAVSCGGATITPKTLRTVARRQVNYVLGSNPLNMSYMVGYGARYPQRIHHRGSSLPSIASHPQRIQCTAGFDIMHSPTPNPNLLVGAVVGGPDLNDMFPDQRSDHEQSEPATYINAPLVGALAYLAHSYDQF
ncbi:hypothetical protein Cgig2_026562 [Carnegiea gigantea]|uniref:Endoglucanase n=1 Tax=Carnegiea gigantea TaxID=171969 RepID=A0A9Q1JR27_9CARY|nr:hypothetical protein Cgig2_026562 [Carnegiea gigantea]